MAKLVLYTPEFESVTLENPEFKLTKQNDNFSHCEVIFQSSIDLYERIKDEGWLNLYPEILGETEGKSFKTDIPIQFTIALNSDLLPELRQYVGSDQADDIFHGLKSLTQQHPLLSTDNWFAKSIWQEQLSHRCGYDTLWSLITDGDPDSAEQTQKNAIFLEKFIKNTTDKNVSNLLSQIGHTSNQVQNDNQQLSKADNQEVDLETIFPTLLKDLSQAFEALSNDEIWQETLEDKGLSDPEDINATDLTSEKSFFLEPTGTKLSKSPLWRLQKLFFSSQVVTEAYVNATPLNVVNSTGFALSHAYLIEAFLKDWAAITKRHKTNLKPLDKTQPIYILELGAGTGQFAYRCLIQLQMLLKQFGLKNLKVKYLLTDISNHSLEFWQQNPSLQPLLEQGYLDVSYFDLENPNSLTLQYSGEVLALDTLANPLIVIANDVFGCLPQDAYYVEAGIVQEDHVSLAVPANTAIDDYSSLSQLSLDYEQRSMSEEETLPETLQQYRKNCDRSHILWPTVALQCLDLLRSLTKHRLVVFSSDVAYCHELALQGNSEPIPQLHSPGYVSLPVNYHALADYAYQHGGKALQPEPTTPSFRTQILLFGDHPTGFLQTQAAYRRHVLFENQSLALLSTFLEVEQLETLSLKQLVSYLQSHYWDAEVFLSSFPILLNKLENITPTLRRDIIQGIDHIQQGYYPINPNTDLSFYLGMLLYSLQDYVDAIKYFERSCQQFGDDPSTLFNLAMTHYRSAQRQKAIFYLKKTLQIDANFEAAQTLLEKLLGEVPI